jgi:hypothetical protein
MYWILFKIIVLTIVPLPVHPKITRPDPKENFWNFSCDGFTSCFKMARIFYTDTLAAKYLVEKSD